MANVTIKRWASKRDATEGDIVEALRDAGAQVEYLDTPCDLLVRYRGIVCVLEVDGITRNRKRKAEQLKFLREWGVPLVKTPEQALKAIGAIT